MARRIIDFDPITCPIDISEIMMRCRVRDPNQQPLIQLLSNDAFDFIERQLGQPLISRQVTWRQFREASDVTRDYFDAWLSGSSFGAGAWGQNYNKWIELPTGATSIDSVVLGSWGENDITLTEGSDYVTDIQTVPARIQFSLHDYMREYLDNYSHIVVQYTTGVATDITTLPGSYKIAVSALVKKCFDENLTFSGNEEILTNAFMSLINEDRRWPIAGGQ